MHFGVKRFHNYLFGCHFTLCTDQNHWSASSMNKRQYQPRPRGASSGKMGPVSFTVLVEGAQLWRIRVHQIRWQYDFDCCRDNSEPDLEPHLPALGHSPIRPKGGGLYPAITVRGGGGPQGNTKGESWWITSNNSTMLPKLLSRKSTETLSYSSLEATRPTAILRGKRCSDSSELLYGVRL